MDISDVLQNALSTVSAITEVERLRLAKEEECERIFEENQLQEQQENEEFWASETF